MGMTIWILSRKKMSDGDNFDHSALLIASEKIDDLCKDLGLKIITPFFDYTDCEVNCSNEEDFHSEEVIRERASWFNPKDILPTMIKLRENLASDEKLVLSLFEEDQSLSEDLLEELNDCIEKLEKIADEGDLFHFCVVI
jgi:hypothetical protein